MGKIVCSKCGVTTGESDLPIDLPAGFCERCRREENKADALKEGKDKSDAKDEERRELAWCADKDSVGCTGMLAIFLVWIVGVLIALV